MQHQTKPASGSRFASMNAPPRGLLCFQSSRFLSFRPSILPPFQSSLLPVFLSSPVLPQCLELFLSIEKSPQTCYTSPGLYPAALVRSAAIYVTRRAALKLNIATKTSPLVAVFDVNQQTSLVGFFYSSRHTPVTHATKALPCRKHNTNRT